MKIIFDLTVLCEETHSVHEMLRKQMERSYCPPPDVLIEDSLWGDKPRKPVQTVLSIEDDYCVMRFESETRATRAQCEELVAAYRGHGWRNPSQWPI